MSSAPTAFPSPCSPSVFPSCRAPVWPSLGVARGLRPPRGGVAPSPIPSMSSIVPSPQGQWPSCVARSLSLAASTPSPASPATSLPCPSPCASGGRGVGGEYFCRRAICATFPPPNFRRRVVRATSPLCPPSRGPGPHATPTCTGILSRVGGGWRIPPRAPSPALLCAVPPPSLCIRSSVRRRARRTPSPPLPKSLSARRRRARLR